MSQVKTINFSGRTFAPVRQDQNGVWHFRESLAAGITAETAATLTVSINPARTPEMARVELKLAVPVQYVNEKGLTVTRIYRDSKRMDIPRHLTAEQLEDYNTYGSKALSWFIGDINKLESLF